MKRLIYLLDLLLVLAQCLLVPLSWLLSVMDAEGVHSLISSQGVRWFLGHLSQFLARPSLVWLLLAAMAGGCLWQSRLPWACPAHYRERMGMWLAGSLLIIYIGVLGLLTFGPHAVLLSATGHLLPSAFSRAFISLLAFGVILVSVAFGVVSGHLRSFADVVDSLSFGIAKAAPLFLLYVLLVQFCESLRFVFL